MPDYASRRLTISMCFPLFYQSDVPRLCRHPGPVREGWVIPERPEDFENLSQDEQEKIDRDLESETIHKYYEAQVYKRAPTHWAVLQQPTIPVIRKPVWLVNGVWENRDLFFLREALMTIQAYWDQFVPDTPCPIAFSDEEINLHPKEEENIKGVGQMHTSKKFNLKTNKTTTQVKYKTKNRTYSEMNNPNWTEH